VLERTQSSPIRGTQRFVLVVRTPRETGAAGIIDLGATVRRRRLGILSHHAQLEDTPEPLTFTIEGGGETT
jgi:hypothetical protein